MIERILSQMGYGRKPLSVTQFPNEESEGFYNVWRVDFPGQSFVVKQAKGGHELKIYQSFLSQPCDYAPRLFSACNVDGTDYLLMEYIPGNNLMQCNRKDLIRTLDSLINMQQTYWMDKDPSKSYARSIEKRQNRAKFLYDAQLKVAYDAYLREYASMPRTLCHDDLLPFNVIITNEKAVFIDWEVAGILPYPTSIARLIAHAEETENALFFMKNEDKSFAIDYYFHKFIKSRGVDYDSYRHCLDLCLLYEYCEWIYVGNKYADTNNDRFRKYAKLAEEIALKIKS